MARLYTLTIRNRWNGKETLNLQFRHWDKLASTIERIRRQRPNLEVLYSEGPTAIYDTVDEAIECADAYFRTGPTA